MSKHIAFMSVLDSNFRKKEYSGKIIVSFIAWIVLYGQVFNDSLSYAKFYSSNVGATVPGGHGTQFRVSIPTIADDLSAKQFVKDRIAAGADYIKLTQEHSMAKLSPQQLDDIVQEAHQQDKKVVGHISTLSDALDLASHKVDGLAHIWYRQGAMAGATDLAQVRNNNLFIIPTLSVIQKVIESAAQNGYTDHYLSFPPVQAEVRKAYAAGIPILAGTDSPNYQLNYTCRSQYRAGGSPLRRTAYKHELVAYIT